MIELSDVTVLRAGRPVLALAKWSASAGTAHCVLGPSGSGKTTLLSILGAMLRPKSGSVRISGMEIGNLSERKADEWRSRSVGIVSQSPVLCDALNVLDNVMLPSVIGRGNASRDDVEERLCQLNVQDCMQRKPSALSYGQKQRVAVARALVNRPMLILADEPSANLDDESCDLLTRLLQQEVETRGATLVVATHDRRMMQEFVHFLKLPHAAQHEQRGQQ